MTMCKLLNGQKTCVNMRDIFEFLDDDASGEICQRELDALVITGDANGDSEVTAREFENAWMNIAEAFGVEPDKHAKYFALIDGCDGSQDDGVIRDAEFVALFRCFDENNTQSVSPSEFLKLIKQHVTGI